MRGSISTTNGCIPFSFSTSTTTLKPSQAAVRSSLLHPPSAPPRSSRYAILWDCKREGVGLWGDCYERVSSEFWSFNMALDSFRFVFCLREFYILEPLFVGRAVFTPIMGHKIVIVCRVRVVTRQCIAIAACFSWLWFSFYLPLASIFKHSFVTNFSGDAVHPRKSHPFISFHHPRWWHWTLAHLVIFHPYTRNRFSPPPLVERVFCRGHVLFDSTCNSSSAVDCPLWGYFSLPSCIYFLFRRKFILSYSAVDLIDWFHPAVIAYHISLFCYILCHIAHLGIYPFVVLIFHPFCLSFFFISSFFTSLS